MFHNSPFSEEPVSRRSLALLFAVSLLGSVSYAEPTATEATARELNAIHTEAADELASPRGQAIAELSLLRDKVASALAQKSGGPLRAQLLENELVSVNRQLEVARSFGQVKMVGPAAKPAPLDSFHYQVALVFSGTRTVRTGLFCGGTAVASRWVVTAAHCVEKLKPRDLDVYFGDAKLSGVGRRYRAARVLYHGNYAPERHENDIGLVLLKENLPGVEPIALLPSDKAALVDVDKSVTVSGWGDRKEGSNDPSNDLMYAELKVIGTDVCNGTDSYAGRVLTSMLCAGDGLTDSCQGDSGGPMVAEDRGTRYLAGVVSWGDGCGRAKKYGVYTRASSFTAWVKKVIAKYGQ